MQNSNQIKDVIMGPIANKYGVISEKKMRGLGINSLQHLNKALIAKWIWRFVNEDKAVWVNILKSIHGENCLNIDLTDVGFNSNWRDLLKHLKDPDIRKIIKRKCGNGDETSFWKDPWISEQLLMEKFLRLYNMEEEKLCTVADRIRNQEINWNRKMENLRGRLEE
ncbi:hypothetical protein LXL04_020706 [Taraxacum kok-saghyz]